MELNVNNCAALWKDISQNGVNLFDGCNVGPVVNFNGFQIKDKDKSSPSCDKIFEKRKYFKNDLPFKKVGHGWPFNSKSKFNVNKNFATHPRNLLSSFSLFDSNYILHPVRQDKVKLLMSGVTHDKETRNYAISRICEVSQCREILKIDSFVHDNHAYTLLHCDDEIRHIRLDDTKMLCTLPSTSVEDCALHHLFSDMFYVLNSNKNIELYCNQRSNPIWSVKINACNSSSSLSCCPADHPYSVYVSTTKNLWVLDNRDSNFSNIYNVFSLSDSSYTNSNEEICSYINVPQTPYVYINCNQTTLLMDRRKCRTPVLSWQHMLRAAPAFPSLVNYNDNQVLAILDGYRKKFCCIATSWDAFEAKGSMQSIKGVSHPRHFELFDKAFHADRIEDFQRTLWLNTHVQSRLNLPLIGMKLIDGSDGDFSICYLNSLGDLFLNSFSFNTHDYENNSKKYRTTLKKYENTCFALSDKSENINQLSGIPLSKLPKRTFDYKRSNFIVKNSPFTPSLWLLNKVVSNFSKKRHKRNNLIENFASDDNFNPDVNFRKDVLDYLPKESQKTLETSYLKSCNDPLSKKLLSVWEEDEENDSCSPTGFFFGTQPISRDLLHKEISKVKFVNYCNNSVTEQSITAKEPLNTSEHDLSGLAHENDSVPLNGGDPIVAVACDTSVKKQNGQKYKKYRRLDGF